MGCLQRTRQRGGRELVLSGIWAWSLSFSVQSARLCCFAHPTSVPHPISKAFPSDLSVHFWCLSNQERPCFLWPSCFQSN